MEYKTSDLNLAAFLKAAHNLKVVRLEPNPFTKDKAFFVFSTTDIAVIERYIASYYNEEDSCSINAFMRELNDLKSWLKDYRINREIK